MANTVFLYLSLICMLLVPTGESDESSSLIYIDVALFVVGVSPLLRALTVSYHGVVKK